jgi:hypothetical protein
MEINNELNNNHKFNSKYLIQHQRIKPVSNQPPNRNQL